MLKRITRILVLFCLLPPFAASTAAGIEREWTVMVYMAGDNDLEPFALKDINEMEKGVPSAGVDVVVLADRAEAYSNDDGDWKDARLYHIKNDADEDRIRSLVLESPGEINTGNPGTLEAFITNAARRFPARHYALILWDHGGGWRQLAHDHAAPGSPDGSDYLDIKEVGIAISHGLKTAGIAKLDMVGFDMCLMAQMEMAIQLGPVADVMVASQAIEPGDGWPYDAILPMLAKPGVTAPEFARGIVGAYGDYYRDRGDRVATLSAIDLKAIDDARKAMDHLIAGINAADDEKWPVLARSLFWAETYADRGDFRAGSNALSSVDLLDVFKRMKSSWETFPAKEAFDRFEKAMNRAVLANFTSPQHRLSNGVAVYAPVMKHFFNPEYEGTAFSSSTRWLDFLSGLYRFQDAQKGKPEILSLEVINGRTGQAVNEIQMGKGFKLKAVVEGNNVLWVQAMVCQPEPAEKRMVILQKGFFFDPLYFTKKQELTSDLADLLMPEFLGYHNEITQTILGMQFLITNGEKAGAATLDQSNFRDLEHVAISGLIRPEGEKEEFFARIYFSVGTWQADRVVVEIPQAGDQVVFRQVEPRAGDEVTLLLEAVDDNGKTTLLRGERLPWKKGLELIAHAAEPGDYRIAARAETLSGKSDFITVAVTMKPLSDQEEVYLDNARKLGERYLEGTWHWFLMTGQVKNGTPVYIDMDTRLTFTPAGSPGVFKVTGESGMDPSFAKTTRIARLDTRLLPTLRLISLSPEKEFLGADNFLLLLGEMAPGQQLLALGNLDPSGLVIGMARPDMYRQAVNAGLIVPMDGQPAPSGSQAGGNQGQVTGGQQVPTLPGSPSPAPQGGYQSGQAAPAFSMAGVWQNQSMDPYGYPMVTQIQFDPSGQFYQRQQSQSGLVLDMWGTYAVGNGFIQFNIAGWNPSQLCFNGACQPVNFPPVNTVPFQVVGQGVIQTPTGNYIRIQ